MTFSCCLIGYGRIGQRHYKNIMNRLNYYKFKLSYIVDHESQIEAIKKNVEPHINVTSSLEDVLNNRNVKLFFICSPTNLHVSHITQALHNGKHVFCEKPIDENIQKINDCYELAKSKNLILFCAYNRRFDAKIAALKTNIHSIGKINQIISITRDYPYPNVNFLKNSSGLFNDCALHDIDFINWILEDRPETVYATAKSTRPIEESANQLDDSCIIMEYSSGISAFIYCSRISKSYDQRIEIFGNDGVLDVKNVNGDISLFTEYGATISFLDRYEESYENELKYFYNVVIGKEPMLITKEESITNLTIIKACEESYNKKQRVIIKYTNNVRNYSNAPKGVLQNYKDSRKNQTVEHVKNMHKKYLTFDKELKMNIIFDYLGNFIDVSDPDISLPQVAHLYQSAESCRKDGQPEWFQFITLIHDLGKIIYIKGCDKDGTSVKEQWGIVGDTFIVGCKIPDSIILPEYNIENPDMENPLYNTELGMYEKNCGLDNTLCSWGHDEYLYQILIHNKIQLPTEALYIIRYHSLYVYHEQNEYKHLMNETDKKYKEFVKTFNKYDLYSKTDSSIIHEDVKNYYDTLIKKFIPNETLFI